MDCGIPFCHEGCPLGQPDPGVERPRVPRRLARGASSGCTPPTTSPSSRAGCARRRARAPACSASTPIRSTIERIEYEIAERGWSRGVGHARRSPTVRTGKSVAVVGSGPAGLACAQQLARAGHSVVVFERAERPGGLLRYGIPEFKMEKAVLDRRLAQLRAEGVEFRCSHGGGRARRRRTDRRSRASSPAQRRALGAASAPRRARSCRPSSLRSEFDAVVLAGGATLPRDLPVAGRHLDGVHLAMDYLKPSNLVREAGLRGRTDHRRGQAASSSSAGATPARTAWARPIAKGRRWCTSSRSCPGPPTAGPTTTRGPRGR